MITRALKDFCLDNKNLKFFFSERMKECRYPGLLYSLLEERVGTDLEIVCKDGSFSCHAVMLAVSEQWWRNLLEPSEQSIGTF